MKSKICSKCKKEFYDGDIVKYFSKATRKKDGFRIWCKICDKEYRINYYVSNRDKILKHKKQYYNENRNTLLELQKKYNLSEKGRYKLRLYRQSEICRNSMRIGNKKYRQTERGRSLKNTASKKYYLNHKLTRTVSTSIRQSLKTDKNGRHWEYLVNYTLDELKIHLEKLFKPGMSWDNYGKHGWHIDHKIPISLFNITDSDCEDFKACWSLNNLQPMWAIDNWKKGNSLNYNIEYQERQNVVG